MQLGIELAKWEGSYQNQTQLWLRWWDSEGNLLLTGAEGKEVEKARGDRLANRAEQADQQVEQERQRAEQADQRAEQQRQRAEQADQRAEQQRQRAEQAEQGRRNAIPQLLAMGMSVEQLAQTLGLNVEEVRRISRR